MRGVLLVEFLQIVGFEGVPQHGYVNAVNSVTPVHEEVSVAGVVLRWNPDAAMRAGGGSTMDSECGGAAFCDSTGGLAADLFVDLIYVGISHKDFASWFHTHLVKNRKSVICNEKWLY